MKVVLSPNPYRDKGLRVAQAARRILEKAGIETVLCLPFALERGAKWELPRDLTFSEMEKELPTAQILLCFGGDGTILHAAKDACAVETPILGVNLGSVGFMAELEQGELAKLTRLSTGEYTVEERMMLEVQVIHEGRTVCRETALNDAVITKGAIARIIDLSVYGDGKYIADFSGDGVIACTPTGSTAYSMSAGGPIVEPTTKAIVVTPICAHSLHVRPLVLGGDRQVSARMGKLSRKTAYLSVDGGKAVKLSAGDRVEISRSQSVTRLVRFNSKGFYEVLAQKLGKG